jgi:predicted site-specific integrase-resolvase
MKLSPYAKQQGISYSTVLFWLHQGVIHGYQALSDTIIVADETQFPARAERIAIYARVSSNEHTKNLE